MASELRLTTADRTLNASIDPSEAVYGLYMAILNPQVREALNAARSCKFVADITGGPEVEVFLSFTTRRAFRVKIR